MVLCKIGGFVGILFRVLVNYLGEYYLSISFLLILASNKHYFSLLQRLMAKLIV
jgi:hypothetical protein